MSVSAAIMVWIAVSCVASPLIGAFLFRQFRDDADYLKLQNPDQVSKRVSTAIFAAARIGTDSRPVPVAAASYRRLGDTPARQRRWATRVPD